MFKEKQCCYVCSLRVGTLVLLWIVMIGCTFHMGYLNLNYYPSAYEESNSNVTNTTDDAGPSNKTIREKRSLLDPGQILGTITNTTGQFVGGVRSAVRSTIDEGRNFAHSARRTIIDQPLQSIENGTFSLIHKPVGDITKQITMHVVQNLKESGAINELSKQLSADMVEAMNDGIFDKRMNEYGNNLRINFRIFSRNLIRCLIRLWDMLGIGSSVLGIYGVHKNTPNHLRYSVIFFRLSTVIQIVVMFITNVDLSVEHTRFLMSELTGMDFVKHWTMFVYFGIFLTIGLSMYFTIVVKNCRDSMLKEEPVTRTVSSV